MHSKDQFLIVKIQIFEKKIFFSRNIRDNITNSNICRKDQFKKVT